MYTGKTVGFRKLLFQSFRGELREERRGLGKVRVDFYEQNEVLFWIFYTIIHNDISFNASLGLSHYTSSIQVHPWGELKVSLNSHKKKCVKQHTHHNPIRH
jgi:hypothetical protein